jgi:hypothetical protein
MSDNELIDAYLAQLARRLPADTVDELTDGLAETYRHHLVGATDPDAAARSALAEFGALDEVTSAFTLLSPGRRSARVLLATGPAVGAAWATALITGHAWQWPVPTPARLTMALLLLAVVAALATAATSQAHYARTRATVLAGGIGMLVLDGAALAGLAVATSTLAWPPAMAASLSLTRIALVLRTLPRIIAS